MSDIKNNYVIDVTTLNNSFITYGSNKNKNLILQMENFNKAWNIGEKELSDNEFTKKWVGRVVYIIIFIQTFFNLIFLKKNPADDCNFEK